MLNFDVFDVKLSNDINQANGRTSKDQRYRCFNNRILEEKNRIRPQATIRTSFHTHIKNLQRYQTLVYLLNISY